LAEPSCGSNAVGLAAAAGERAFRRGSPVGRGPSPSRDGGRLLIEALSIQAVSIYARASEVVNGCFWRKAAVRGHRYAKRSCPGCGTF
jgi:hypothetical protein